MNVYYGDIQQGRRKKKQSYAILLRKKAIVKQEDIKNELQNTEVTCHMSTSLRGV